MKKSKIILIITLFLLGKYLHAQPYIPGQTYWGTRQYIEYQPGNLPLIISVPHGGYEQPSDIRDRQCEGCAYVQDAFTQELARTIREIFVKETGCYPYMIYNRIHRKKLDMNRDIIMATDSNSSLDVYWHEYHNFIDSAKKHITLHFGKGLFIDLHGHGHTKQRIEYGYLLYDSQLRESDSLMNTAARIRVSSIESLAGNNAMNTTHAELIRGNEALGTQFAERGYPGVPSKQDPFPLIGDPYFNGGYNTYYHGSSPGGTIDAIQMELYSDIRFDSVKRTQFARNFVAVALQFLDRHYFPGFSGSPCSMTGIYDNAISMQSFRIVPNPTSTLCTVYYTSFIHTELTSLTVYNIFGQPVFHESDIYNGYSFPVHTLPTGMYSVVLHSHNKTPIITTSLIVH